MHKRSSLLSVSEDADVTLLSTFPQVRSSLQTKAKQTVWEPNRDGEVSWATQLVRNSRWWCDHPCQLCWKSPPTNHRVYIIYWRFALQIATFWTFYTRDFVKKVIPWYTGIPRTYLPGTVTVPTCRLPRLLDICWGSLRVCYCWPSPSPATGRGIHPRCNNNIFVQGS